MDCVFLHGRLYSTTNANQTREYNSISELWCLTQRVYLTAI